MVRCRPIPGKDSTESLWKFRPRRLWWSGPCAGIASKYAIAYTFTLSSYVEAVKQIEILFALAIGGLAFGEQQKVRESGPGAIVMLAGMILVRLAG